MMILGLEFSSTQRSVALARGGRLLAEISETGGHGTPAFRLIEKVLASAKVRREEIEVLAVGLGPGSYSGIRVALAMAQGWQLATGIKLLGISSVEVLAARAQAEQMFGRVNLIVDAQRGEFYQAIFEVAADRLVEIEPLKIVTVTAIAERMHAGELMTGPEVTRWFPTGKNLFPSAATLVSLAEHRNDFCHGKQLEPIYLREASFLKIPAQMKH